MARPRTRPTAGRSSDTLTTIRALPLLAMAGVVAAQSSSLPQIDFSSLGTVAVVGNFAGLSFYDPSNPPQTYDSRASTLLARTVDGDLRRVGATDDGGSISAICQSPDETVFVGGNFTSMGGVAAANIAGYNSSSETFFALGDGLKGEVRTLSCNGTTVYAGGDFTGPTGGPNVAAWSTTQKAWTDLPLYGFNGAVESIQPSQDGRSLFFGGAFSTTFSNSSAAGSLSSASSSSSPDFPSLGSSLTPISLNSSDYWASPTTWESGFGRPQYIFCPRHADGIGASWLLVDGEAGFFIARMYRQLNVRGIRLGNTFYEGRGTQNFSVVSIPDDQVLELTYASDPSDPSSPLVTCSSDCPLAHNESIPYQDFLFPEGTSLTGFQLNIFGWYGAGGGLHLLQLLSEGSYAYAVADDNLSPCTNGLGASTQASVSTSGSWTKSSVFTSIAGTTQEVLVADVKGGSGASSNAPSVTWQPYVAEAGQYAVYFVTPGCTQAGTCAQRTSVLVTATPHGGQASETTIDQTNSLDESTLIYNGTLSAGADSLSVKMTLAPSGAPDAGKTYQLVADYINLVAASTNGSSIRIERGFGLFEYPLVDTGAFGDAVPTAQATGVNASSTLTNATGLDAVSFHLDQGAVVNSIVTIGTGSDAQVFVGGNFTFSNNSQVSHNVLRYKLDQVIVAPNGGLNGIVNSLVELDGAVYAAGTFTATQDNAVSGLDGIAKWNYSSVTNSAWEPLGNVPPVGGSIQQLSTVGSGAKVAIIAAGGGGSGLAFYEPATSSWNSTAAGLFLGNLTAAGVAAAPTSSNATTYLAGNILAAAKNGAPGGAILSSDKHGNPQLSSFGFGFNSSSNSSKSPAVSSKSATSRRALIRKNAPRSALEPRAPQPASSVNLTLPSPIQAIAATNSGDQILAGAFWKNGSTNVMLVGGSFASSTGVTNLGAYDSKAQTLSALPGESVAGTVTTLDVIGDVLWVGGNFTTGSGRQGFTTYDLQHTTPDDSQPPLSGWAGMNATVNAIAQRPGYDDQVIVAGAFASAGSLYCASVCLWDNKKLQWSSLATGLQGVVGAIDFAGDKSEYLIAAGNFVLNDETRYVARWSFKNSTWLSLGAAGDLPGPATAVSADDRNEDKVFVAGSSTSGAPYLRYWNGTTWSDITNNTLGAGSGIQQLAFVPLSNSHAANKVVESNRMLLVSGDLQINDTSISSALYDGESWYPYLIATSATGSAGIVSKLFYSVSNFSLSGGNHLAAGLVILISIAIGLGLVFLLVLIGLLIALARRRDEPQYQPPDARRGYESGTETSSINGLHRPNSLLQTVGAATAVLLDPKGEKAVDHDSLHGGAAGGSFDDGALGYGSDYGDDAEPSTALARYSFHAEHPGELTISTNEQLTILESSDPNWWMVANSQGQRGLVPLSYLA